MQYQLKNLVEAVRSGRGMDQAMLAAQVELLVANNPGRATAHDPATAGPDDLQRRLCATVDACRAICGPAYFTWPQVEEICAVLIRQIAKLEPADMSAPNGCECLAGCQCEHCIVLKGWRTVEINGKQYTLDENARPKTDAEVAILARTWGVTDSQLNAALGRLPMPPKPAGPPTVLVGLGCKVPQMPHSGVWKPYPADCPTTQHIYDVRLASGEQTVRGTVANGYGGYMFPKALDPMNEVVEWLD